MKYVNLNRDTLSGIYVSGRTALADDFALRRQLGSVRGRNDDTGEDQYHMVPLNARTGVDYVAGQWDGSVDLIGVK
jgi:hypothetical protein